MVRRMGMAALAEAAGVSIATVDRALNGRGTVSPGTRTLILDAALRTGHPAVARLEGREHKTPLPEVRFGILLHKQGQDFYKAFAEELHRSISRIQGIQGRLVLEFSTSQSPSEMAQNMRAMEGRCDILAATAVNHIEITSAVEDLKSKNLRVISLLSDFAQGVRYGYFGLNNLKMGRTAGWVSALAAKGPGKLLLFVGGHRWHGHELREIGYRTYLREVAPQFEVLETIINLETRQLTYETTLAALSRYPDLRGIYVAGGGMEGAIAAIREVRVAGEIVLVCPALTAESRRGLAEGVVTLVSDTPLEKLCRELFDRMCRAVLQPNEAVDMGQVFLPPDIYLAESI
jgi:LacI family transcriptional regulator